MVTTTASKTTDSYHQVSGLRVKVQRAGSGDPIVVLHQDIGSPGIEASFIQELAGRFTVYLPTHPGFDGEELPTWARHPRDIALLHLWLLHDLGLGSADLVGLGFGGWVAAEMATMNHQLVRKLVLSGAMGVKPTEGEILDEFVMSSTEFVTAGFHDRAKLEAWFGAEPDIDQLEAWEINREMSTRLTWKPYMFNPALPQLLGGVKAPTLVVWGKQNAVVPLSSARRYQELIPNAHLELIEDCGHLAEYEQPEKLGKLVGDFLSS